jgi:hypothetical protein
VTNGKQETDSLRRSRKEFLAVIVQDDAIKQNTIQNKGNFLTMCEVRHGYNAACVRTWAMNKVEGQKSTNSYMISVCKEPDLIADKHFTV